MKLSFFLLSSLALVWGGWGTLSRAALAQTEPLPPGQYSSQIGDGLGFQVGITEFFVNDIGDVQGSYIIREEDGLTLGLLTDCGQEAQELDCLWFDRYGSGDLLIEFSEDWGSFQGTWGREDSDERLPWRGVRDRSGEAAPDSSPEAESQAEPEAVER